MESRRKIKKSRFSGNEGIALFRRRPLPPHDRERRVQRGIASALPVFRRAVDDDIRSKTNTLEWRAVGAVFGLSSSIVVGGSRLNAINSAILDTILNASYDSMSAVLIMRDGRPTVAYRY